MHFWNRRFAPVFLIGAMLSACAEGGVNSDLTTSSVTPAVQAQADQRCGALLERVKTLRKDGISERVEAAAKKKYKLTADDAVRADQLNKNNAEYQDKCVPQSSQAAAKPTAAAVVSQQ